ncbi:tRNA isopentenyl-2-thiomethyl-A-37 hydroxylase MiaE [Pseudoalteromonas sp. MEBiC 03485]|uniref:tRNA isopentenyl-2-thiomethyl-A-37 hydroxylase MiaE n=1 Tax=Pseudoalteromonas sp. MEBiC 03485 TaxID=2571103 RepID=UPI00101FE849|nr:hypothetical protein EVU92_09160 [Pseudoalteromonas sp. MEBiC 03485]
MNINDIDKLLKPIDSFLKCGTPEEWIKKAQKKENLDIVLLDHLVCELNDNMCIYNSVSNNYVRR